jgi:5-methylcytosine-specific restriction endonuclease McrA
MPLIHARKSRERTSQVRQSQVTLMRKRMRAKYGEDATYWTLSTWEKTLKAFQWKCVYCQMCEGSDPRSFLTADHFIPAKEGGLTKLGNITPACRACNSKKGAKLPQNFCGAAKYERIKTKLDSLRPAGKGEIQRTGPIKGGCHTDQKLSFFAPKTKSKKEKKTMALLNKNTGNTGTEFELCPEVDTQAIVCDIVDHGWLEAFFKGDSKGMKPHVQIVYQVCGTDENDEPVLMDNGKRFLVFGRKQILSTADLAGFYKELCGILGKKNVDSALESGELDTEDLVGKNVNIVTVHNAGKTGDKVFCNIENMKPWNTKNGPNMEVLDYVRRCDRDDWKEKRPAISAFDEYVVPSDDELSARTGNRSVPQEVVQAPNKRATAPRDEDPRAVNNPDTRKEAIKNVMKGEVPTTRGRYADDEDEDGDEPSVFDDNLTPEQEAKARAALQADHQATLVEAPAQSRNVAHA